MATRHSQVIADLDKWGPQVSTAARWSLKEASDYCRRMARTEYENFTVASWLLPRALRSHFCHVYAYCRWADDLADESADPHQGLALLDWWERSLADCYRGRAIHPVFIALMETIETFQIPEEPFRNLLRAFRQDQRQTRYISNDELLNYCRHSANPVGAIVLHLGRCWTPENQQDSDSICTGLQLANFCQDVSRDAAKGRIYLPIESWRKAGYTEAMFARREYNEAFRQMLAEEVTRAESFLRAGSQLVNRLPRELQIDVTLFVQGGLAILDAIRRQQFDVWRKRPTVGKFAKLQLVLQALLLRVSGRRDWQVN